MSSDRKFTAVNINILKNDANTGYIKIIIQMLISFTFVSKSKTSMNITEVYKNYKNGK